MLPGINIPFEYAGNALGASADELKLISVFLVSYPLAAILKRLPDSKPWLKSAYIVSVSIFFLIGLFDLWGGLGVIVFDAAATYLIAAKIPGPYMPWIGFTFLMGHMSVSHLSRQFSGESGSVDITAAQMVMVMKLSAFCWNVWDGKQKDSDLSAFQKDRALKKMPDILSYAAFVGFFPSLFPGPAFDYADYDRWLNTSMFDLPPGTESNKAPATKKQRKIPRSGTPAMKKLAQGLLWIFAFMQLGGIYNKSFVLSDTFMNYNFFHRILCLYLLGLTQRCKYYGVWLLTEGSCILAGIGYKGVDPKTGKPSWDRLNNIKPLEVELSQNSHTYLAYWNINTNVWLRNYVYLRVTPKGKKPGFSATLATFVTSAFWHGFYPGYYMAFLLASFVQNIAKNSRRLLRPFFMTPDGSKPTQYKPIYDVFSWFMTHLTFTFNVVPFILLTYQDTLKAWGSVYYYGIVGTAACSIALLTPAKQILSKQVKARSTRSAKKQDSPDEGSGKETLGVPGDPGKQWDVMVDEVVAEVNKRRGNKAGPDASELRRNVQDRLSALVQEASAK
ncbi:MBOAT-domain-containing protein [Polychaeton citri CBS 116435]|uniref:MBOAT-domain-containing protein n=1 Tax=Polychaeton citri CBS 116435 TaxID=1314669 RepID=A0A9P4UPY0_9PEZI|nr:MBOAT-domain-containing protein [Polychaeton citri CBS 116435]